MARKKQVEEHVNHERWLVSYADFITLLFAFFVVMYSMSSVNEDKYRVLSHAMDQAFRDPKSALNPIQIGELVRSPLQDPDRLKDISEEQRAEAKERAEQDITQNSLDVAEAEIADMADAVEYLMEDLIEDEIIDVKRNKFWLEVDIKSKILFPSGSADLIVDSQPVLIELAELFIGMPNRINIEGFTDNRPISNQVFPSNWELSAARASAVVRLFEQNGIESSRLASIGYGEHQPITDNSNEEARAKNRRVVMVVMADLGDDAQSRIYELELLKDR